MDWEAAVRQRLLGDSACAALVGDRVFLKFRPQASDLPALVLTVVSDPDPQTLRTRPEYRASQVQIDCWADGGKDGVENTRAEVVALRKAAKAALSGPFLQSGVSFGRTQFDPVRDLGQPSETGFVYRDSFDAMLWHN